MVLGNRAEARASASGGTAPYSPEFQATPAGCRGPAPSFGMIEGQWPGEARLCCGNTGTLKVVCLATDSSTPPKRGKSAEVRFTVVGPNDDSCTPNASRPTPGTPGASVRMTQVHFKRGGELIGEECYESCVQERFWSNVGTRNNPNRVSGWNNLNGRRPSPKSCYPGDHVGTFYFDSPNVNDIKWATGGAGNGNMIAEYKQQLRIWTSNWCGVSTEVQSKEYWLQIWQVNGEIDIRLIDTF